MSLTLAEQRELAEAIAILERRSQDRILGFFRADGPLGRDYYPKHLQFFAAGATHRERLMLSANRVGKTIAGAYEMVLHLTGAYDEFAPWWTGRRFTTPIQAWAAGDTSTTVRDILQVALLGKPGAHGTGMIPAHLLVRTTGRAGVPGAVENIEVRHVSGQNSMVQLRSYDQRREAFQGTSQHVIWLDEECPEDIHTECLLRTMDTPDLPGGGLLMLTFTPLMGLTPLVLQFLPGGQPGGQPSGSKFVVMATWDDVPHLTPAAREELWATIPPYQRDARTKGIPQLGSGAIYQVAESEITVPDFPIPKHWPRAFALDTGWDVTAALWGALDRETNTAYIYSVYKRGHAEPAIHAEAIRARGAWIHGCGDVAAIQNKDGVQFIDIYKRLGLKIQLADKAVEAGLHDTWGLLSAGKLKVFASCAALFEEYRLYRRDEKGRIVKENDHLMDCLRYWVRTGRSIATAEAPLPEKVTDPFSRYAVPQTDTSWMA